MAHDYGVSLDDALELLHFAFREIVLEPDRILTRRGLSRVHHRILYICRRQPDLPVGGLCRVLGVSKQAIHRPLGDLVRAGLIASETNRADRRARQLQLTAKGRALEEQLSELQRREFARAFEPVGRPGAKAWARVMAALGHGKSAAALLARGARARSSAA